MMSRTRRYLRYLLVLGSIAVLLLAVNFALVWYYRHASGVIRREMAAKGYPATFKEMVAQQHVNDGRHNGADDLLAAMDKFNDDGVNYDFVPIMGNSEVYPAVGQAFRPEVLAEMNKVVSLNKEMLALVRSGVRAEICRFPVEPGGSLLFPIEQTSKLRNAIRLLHVQSLCAAESGDEDAAIDVVNTILLFGYQYDRQPTMLGYLVGVSWIGIGESAATELLERGYLKEPAQFDRLSEILDHATTGDLVYSEWTDALLEGEYARRHSMAASRQKALESHHLVEAVVGLTKAYANQYTFVGDAGRLEDLKTIRAFSAIVREPLLTTMRDASGIPIPDTYVRIEGKYRAQLRAAATATRVMRFRLEHARLPDQKEFKEVIKPSIDPFDGQPLRFRIDEDRVVVYSIGPNGKDDGGTERFGGGEKRTDDFGVEIRSASPVAN